MRGTGSPAESLKKRHNVGLYQQHVRIANCLKSRWALNAVVGPEQNGKSSFNVYYMYEYIYIYIYIHGQRTTVCCHRPGPTALRLDVTIAKWFRNYVLGFG